MIIHLHIPKTAGTSLLAMLRKNLNVLRIDKWTGAVDKNVQCISGHFTYGEIYHHFDDYKHITFLRNPVDRLVSFYAYVTQRGKKSRWADQVRGKTFLEFLLSGYQDNQMVRHIAGMTDISIHKVNEVSDKHLKLAIENIKKFHFVGIKENYSQDVQRLCETIDVPLPTDIPHLLNTKSKKKVNMSSDELIIAKHITNYDQALYDFVIQNLV